MLFGRGISSRSVTPGSVFCRDGKDGGGDILETARVLSVGKDSYGIPHVRFEISFRHPSFSRVRDSRVLALSSFARQYPDRL